MNRYIFYIDYTESSATSQIIFHHQFDAIFHISWYGFEIYTQLYTGTLNPLTLTIPNGFKNVTKVYHKFTFVLGPVLFPHPSHEFIDLKPTCTQSKINQFTNDPRNYLIFGMNISEIVNEIPSHNHMLLWWTVFFLTVGVITSAVFWRLFVS